MSRTRLLLTMYTLTLFVSALLLFLVQPLIGKLIVPSLGGSPAVWNTCMVFFQAMLLAGYAYAHWSTRWLGERAQSRLHLAILLLPVVVLPLGLFKGLLPAGDASPVLGVLVLLAASIGLPFFVISATAPLLQRWFASTDHPDGQDPYFLYAASNIGSMLALLSYPLVVERLFKLDWQRWTWTAAYVGLVALIAACARLMWRSPQARGTPPPQPASPRKKGAPAAAPYAPATLLDELAGPPLAITRVARPEGQCSPGRILRWVALAFVPSSLMLGATTYITTDIAAIPLLWVLPLALYLLSFILVFGHWPSVVHWLVVLAMPVLLLLLVFLMVSQMSMGMTTTVLLHLLILFVVALVCHGELARSRPDAAYLTQFYLWMSVGGVLGGLFNALLAPLLFNSLAEYPLAMVLAALMLPRMAGAAGTTPANPVQARTRVLDLALPMLVAAVSVEFFSGFKATHALLGDRADALGSGLVGLATRLGLSEDQATLILTYAPPIILCYAMVERAPRFSLALGALLLASALPALRDPEVVFRDRSFFGALRVKEREEAHPYKEEEVAVSARRLMHGNILHGMQLMGPFREEPLTYYHRTGPIGRLMTAFPDKPKKDIAVIGLGTGTMACYPQKGQRLTFYEIDRHVKQISYDQDRYFTFVADARDRGAEVDLVLGDARLQMDRERKSKPDERYDIIVVDAFSSDAIPVHLITREALDIYLDKLKDDGVIAFHISNRYVRLEPVVANLAAERGLAAWAMHDADEEAPGKTLSSWVMVARDEAHFGNLRDDLQVKKDDGHHWERLEPSPDLGVWSDDYCNVLSVFRWGTK